MIGKRKRDTHVVSRSTTSEEDEATTTTTNDSSSHDIFRKFFEAQFQPLEAPETRITCAEGSDDEHGTDGSEESELESEWSGVSEDIHGDNKVEVVEHHDLSAVAKEPMDKRARKAFMVCL